MTTDDPELFGTIPARTDFQIIKADPEDRKIRFTTYEQMGVDIHRVPEGVTPSAENIEELTSGQYAVFEEDGLREGDRVLCARLVGGWAMPTISIDEKGKPCATTEHGFYLLEFVNDRLDFSVDPPVPAPPRWSCGGYANMRALKKLTIDRD